MTRNLKEIKIDIYFFNICILQKCGQYSPALSGPADPPPTHLGLGGGQMSLCSEFSRFRGGYTP